MTIGEEPKTTRKVVDAFFGMNLLPGYELALKVIILL